MVSRGFKGVLRAELAQFSRGLDRGAGAHMGAQGGCMEVQRGRRAPIETLRAHRSWGARISFGKLNFIVFYKL